MTKQNNQIKGLERRVQITFYIIGGAAVLFGALTTILGSDQTVGTTVLGATADNQMRFLSALYAGLGLVTIRAAKKFHSELGLLKLLLGIYFAGALSRVLSYVVVGSGNQNVTLAMIIELIFPVVLFYYLNKVTKK